MPVIKRVQSKITIPTVINRSPGPGQSRVAAKMGEERPKQKKYCQFCRFSQEPRYWEANALRRFVSDRGRIIARARTGTCSKHQRRVSREIKRARHLALLPFTVRV